MTNSSGTNLGSGEKLQIQSPASNAVPDKAGAPPARIPQLDGLRGMAVALVILYHYFSLDLQLTAGRLSGLLKSPFRMGWCGVDLFFVLSGFLIGGILLDARGSKGYFKTFYLRRFHRIFPLYYLWIASYVLIAFTFLPYLRGALRVEPEKWTMVPTYLFFVQNLVKKEFTWFASAWLSPLWSLAVEEQFYLVMPLLVR